MEHIFLRCEEKFSRSQMQKPEQNTRFSALKYFFQIFSAAEELGKRLDLLYVQKKVRISDQVMEPTSVPQTAIFVYFIGAHVSGIWVLGK